jgi:hypothetical protein
MKLSAVGFMSMVYFFLVFVKSCYWWGGGLSFLNFFKKNLYTVIPREQGLFEIAVFCQMFCSYVTVKVWAEMIVGMTMWQYHVHVVLHGKIRRLLQWVFHMKLTRLSWPRNFQSVHNLKIIDVFARSCYKQYPNQGQFCSHPSITLVKITYNILP